MIRLSKSRNSMALMRDITSRAMASGCEASKSDCGSEYSVQRDSLLDVLDARVRPSMSG